MKRFRFRYQRVLEAKRHIEEQKRNELAQRLAEQQREEAHLRDLEGALVRRRAEWRAQLAEFRHMEVFVMYEAYFRSLLARMDVQSERIREALARVEEKRAELVEARRRVRILERLLERDLAAFRQAVERWEQHATDEIAVNQFLRQRREQVEARN